MVKCTCCNWDRACRRWRWLPDSSDKESKLSVDWLVFIRVMIPAVSGDESSAKVFNGGEVSLPAPDWDPTKIKQVVRRKLSKLLWRDIHKGQAFTMKKHCMMDFAAMIRNWRVRSGCWRHHHWIMKRAVATVWRWRSLMVVRNESGRWSGGSKVVLGG